MKRINKLFVVLFFVCVTANIYSQSASVTWPLTSNQNPNTPTGNIQALPQTIGTPTSPYKLEMYPQEPYSNSNRGQQLWTGNQGTGWIAGMPDYTRYSQFNVNPTSGNNFTIQHISFQYCDYPTPTNTDFHILKSEVWYAIDNNWNSSVQLNSNPSNPLDYLSSAIQIFSTNVNVVIQNGHTFSIRIYPYAPNGAIAMTPSFATHKNITISGTTSSSAVNPCSVNILNISTGWNYNSNITYNANNPATDQDVFWTLVTAPTNNGSVNLNGPAWVISKNSAWSAQTGSQWISAFNTSGQNQANSNTLPPYVFQKSICVDKTTNLTFDLSVLVDNRVVINFVNANGNVIDSLVALNTTTLTNFTTPTTISKTVQNVSPGTYYIRIELRNDTPGSPMGVNVQGTVTGVNSSLLGALCCNPPGSSISGTKFNDLDNNGLKSGSEPVLPGWVITLTAQGVSMTSTTDSNGNFLFTGLQPGTYTVEETSQLGWTPGPTGSQQSVTVGTNVALNNINFGNRQLGSICGTKFNDLNGNGVKDSGETGIANWQINLTGASTATTTTDNNGNYCFTNLIAGTYTVSETNQTYWQQTFPSSPGTYTINLTAGQNATNINFGNKLIAATSCVTPPSGMVGWWPMDESVGATTVHDIAGTNNGIPQPGPIGLINSITAGAIPGNTLQFLNPHAKVDGSLYFYSNAVLKYIRVLNNSVLNFGTGSFTIDAWVYPVLVGPNIIQPLVDKTQTTVSNCIGYRLFINNSQLNFVVMDGNNVSIIAAPITYSQWQHIVAVRKGGTPNTFELYINGILTTTTTGQVNSVSNTSDFIIGGIPPPNGSTLCGLPSQFNWGEIAIDELEIFNCALTISEIFSIFHADTFGKCKPTTDAKEKEHIPDKFMLMQNYPNPFNPTTTIRYDLPKAGFVKITIYDILGREVRVLVNEEKTPGVYEVKFDARNLASGVYFYTIRTPQNFQSKKMILLK